MTQKTSAGLRFRQSLEVEKPLQIIGTVNAYAAMMAKQVGYKAIYLSGAGVANYSYGLPDLGMTSLDNVLEDVRRITERVVTPNRLREDCAIDLSSKAPKDDTLNNLVRLHHLRLHSF